MSEQRVGGKCVYCGGSNLQDSHISLKQWQSFAPVSVRRDGQPMPIEDEHVYFSAKRCLDCNYVHLFYTPDPFKKSTLM
jgi:predicted nucleic-acid-binding Zn-ribbon protein